MATRPKRLTTLAKARKTHSADGVDLTLIRWMLSLTPAQRLQVLERHVQSIMRLRGEQTKA